jgi:hypothetical protein
MSDREETTVIFRLSRVALGVQAAVVVLFLGTSINAVFLVLLDTTTPTTIKGMTAIVIAIMVGYAVYVTAYFIQRWLDPPPPIAITPDGLFDRGLANSPIPWDAIANAQIVRVKGGENVMFHVRSGYPGLPRFRRLARIMRGLNLAFGLPPYQVMQFGTDASVEKLVAAMTPYISIAGA